MSPAEEVEVARRYEPGALVKDLAIGFRTHRTTTSQSRHRLGIPTRWQRLQSKDAPAARLYDEGWSLDQLGEEFGCDHYDVRNKLVAGSIPMRTRPGWRY